MKNKAFALLASAATVSAGLIGGYAPANAAGLSGSIGFAGDITVTGIGYCPNTAGPGVVLCTSAAADPTRPLTTLDFQKIVTGGPDVFPNGAEVQVTGTTGSFLAIDPPPPDFGTLEDLGTLPPIPTPAGNGFTLANFPNPGNPIVDWAEFSNGSVPQFRYKFDLESLSFPVYTTSIDPVTGEPTTTISLAYSGTMFDTATGMIGNGEGALSADFVGQDAASLQAFFAQPGNVLPDISFSSTIVVTPEIIVQPEASTLIPMLGLGLYGASVVARKKLRQK